MSDDETPKFDINDIRREIDRVDNALLGLIAERLELAAAVRRAKSGVRLWRPSREQDLVRDLAEKSGDTPAHLVSRIWAELVSASLSLQGPMHLHVALDDDPSEVRTIVRDRFGAALPLTFHPTPSAALSAAYAESEGVAVLPAPGGMHSWWRALCSGGALQEMQILAGLPRISDDIWPSAVAVAAADRLPSGDDITLVALTHERALPDQRKLYDLRAEAGNNILISLDGYYDDNSDLVKSIVDRDSSAQIIGVIAKPLKDTA